MSDLQPPDEAVEALARAKHEAAVQRGIGIVLPWKTRRVELETKARRQLEEVAPALPAIYADLRERMLSKEALQAAADAICLDPPAPEADRNEVRIEIEAALDTAMKGGGDGAADA